MKIKFHLICSVLLFLGYVNIFPSTGGIGFIDHLIPKEEYLRKELTRGIDLTEERKKELEKLSDSPIKYISHLSNDILFGKTVFNSANYFYLGASGTIGGGAINSSTLMRTYITYDSTEEKNIVNFAPLAPREAYVNDQEVDGNKAKVENPIYDKRVMALSMMGQYPALTLDDATVVDGVNFVAKQVVCLVDDINFGGSVKTNIVKLKDASIAGADATVQGIEGSYDSIFAAVYPDGGRFGENNNSGFTRLTNNGKKLQQIENPAISLNLNFDGANPLLAIGQDAEVAGLGGMYWDSTLKRLFIGLLGVERVLPGNQGGVISILVGRIDNNVLTLEPCVALDAALFTNNDNDFVFGFNYENDNTDIKASIYNLRTMHTSTGYSYLIVNGGISDGDINNKFYALPLVSQGDAVANIGKIAKNDNFNRVPAVVGDMSKSGTDPVDIGGGDLITEDKIVRDMFVVGDSVYVCLAENRTVDDEAGIFRSTAIFANDGKIRAWTNWQRVMGSDDKVFGAGLDTTLGNFWYLTDSLAGVNTVKITQWGKSEKINGLMGNGLVEILNKEFKQEDAGVHQIFNFDEKTPCLARVDAQYEQSLMVATGFEKIAIIKTGSGSSFTQENEFISDAADPNRNVYVWDNDDALKNIGPICCAEVSRVDQINSYGWLFVGGFGGALVLRNDDGNGWDGQLATAAMVDLPAISGWTFKELRKADGSSFLHIRKIICQKSGWLNIMTDKQIYRFIVDTDKFKNNNPDLLGEKNLTPPPGSLLDMLLFYRANNDTRLLVATTSGLFYSNAIDDVVEDKVPGWTQVHLNSGDLLSSPVSHLSFVSTEKGGSTTNGNLYAVGADLSLNLANIYRFNVDPVLPPLPAPQQLQPNPITEVSGTDYFYTIGELRTNFLTDGTFGFNLLSKHLGKSNFLRKINIGSDQYNLRRYENVLDLDLDENAYNVGVISQNSASGAWIVPGDWGIRVND